ncbi:DivIVA domain-containing protein [Micromonospora inyonensis]|uniref:DivIVA domain-containing protein n=1 Tax=Micromonospora inyonensis TaxID=47866 RepID=A0A1C6R8U2_9ACTN|nr:DivIVA domain-containing protein [Micromonospora inyonensis]SCL13503.1 DivIVA domain-containing protein [Micromonospora inyonensis]
MRFFPRRAGDNRRPTGGGSHQRTGGGSHRPGGGEPAATRPPGPGVYRSRAYAPLRSWQVRRRRFRTVGLFRRGLDPADVREFLDRVADDLADLYDELNQSREETSRIKDALRRWQSEYASRVNERTYR